ncbi:transcriptional regulator RutR [Klebsiella pneumoniae]|uniref:Transcriptional regulator RutR n=1 Tax=Klebsiella pneumoniae TaxID=573 RepID=A0A3S4HUH9_KLEPN|nr:transcriptional regulator RutR [Klebsiella pneumoniae]
MPLRNHISRIFVDHPQDPVLALTMMVETLAHMAEKNAWFAPLWMQEIIAKCRFCASIWMPASARSVFR